MEVAVRFRTMLTSVSRGVLDKPWQNFMYAKWKGEPIREIVDPLAQHLHSASAMAEFVYSLFEKTNKTLTASHRRIANYHGLAGTLIVLAFLGCAALVSVCIWSQKVFLIPGILALIAAYLSGVSLWTWVYLSNPLIVVACLLIPFTLHSRDIRTAVFLIAMCFWFVFGIPLLYVCIQFIKCGRRLLVRPIEGQDSRRCHHDVNSNSTPLTHPLPAYTTHPASPDIFNPSSVKEFV